MASFLLIFSDEQEVVMNEFRKIKDPQSHGAHSGTRSGISDYNDGANVTDQLGNDDQNPNFGVFDSGLEDDDTDVPSNAVKKLSLREHCLE